MHSVTEKVDGGTSWYRYLQIMIETIRLCTHYMASPWAALPVHIGLVTFWVSLDES